MINISVIGSNGFDGMTKYKNMNQLYKELLRYYNSEITNDIMRIVYYYYDHTKPKEFDIIIDLLNNKVKIVFYTNKQFNGKPLTHKITIEDLNTYDDRIVIVINTT